MENQTYYVTARGSYKGPNGVLYLPGDIFPHLKLQEGGLAKLIRLGQLCDDAEKAATITGPDHDNQEPLPYSSGNTGGNDEDNGRDPVSFVPGHDAETRSALRENQREARERKSDDLDARIEQKKAELAALTQAVQEEPEELVTRNETRHSPPLAVEAAHDDGCNTSEFQKAQDKQELLEAARGQHFDPAEAKQMGLVN